MNLVYNVYPLPESMFYFLWNYDNLDIETENELIYKIIRFANK